MLVGCAVYIVERRYLGLLLLVVVVFVLLLDLKWLNLVMGVDVMRWMW